MNDTQALVENFIAAERAHIPLTAFLFNLILATVFAWILARVYVRCGQSLSNRERFSSNFVAITLVTMVVITVVKSSLALSLGLVGALSIVRFRTPIKEPEELTYIFFAIALGLGLGADQRIITSVAFFFIIAIFLLRDFLRSHQAHEQNMLITLAWGPTGEASLEAIVEKLRAHSQELRFDRLDESETRSEAAFMVHFADFEQLQTCRDQLKALEPSLEMTIVENIPIN
ncbi:DUF4956 domain-containing protein [Magnetococcales bacterium HHB-1]